jgi:hypothetical protein
MRMRVYYVDCHEAGLCWYLVIHIQTLIRPLHLLYFQMWPIYRVRQNNVLIWRVKQIQNNKLCCRTLYLLSLVYPW